MSRTSLVLVKLARFLHLFLVLSLLLQSSLAVFVQQGRLAAFQAQIEGDKELICTGTQMKWISHSLTEQTGAFVFVEPPEEFNDTSFEHLCPVGEYADIQPFTKPAEVEALINFQVFRALVTRLDQRPYTLFAYQSPLSRAPPSLI